MAKKADISTADLRHQKQTSISNWK